MINRNLSEINQETSGVDFWRRLSIVIFAIGAILGMALIAISVYADFEASLFDVTISMEGKIRRVSCPVFVDAGAPARVKATYKNTSQESDIINVESHISRGKLVWFPEEEKNIHLDAGEKLQFTWDVFLPELSDPNFVLTKMMVSGRLSGTTFIGSCGLTVINLPGGMTGEQFFWLSFSAVTICLWTGIGMWLRNRRTYTGKRVEAAGAIIGMGVLIQAGIIATAVGWWEAAAMCFYIVILLIGVIIPHFFVKRRETRKV
ncbi:hypothetical protein KQH54_00420 [bacterium]|nr:hypothetical protein [bacterium]